MLKRTMAAVILAGVFLSSPLAAQADNALGPGTLKVRALSLFGEEKVARVLVDGEYKGMTPFEEEFSAGRYDVKVEATEGQWWGGVSVESGEVARVDAVLKKRMHVRLAAGLAGGVLVHEGDIYRSLFQTELQLGLRMGSVVLDLGVFGFLEAPNHVFVRPGLMYYLGDQFYLRGAVPIRVYEGIDAGGTVGPGYRFSRFNFAVFVESTATVLSGSGFSTVPVELRAGVELLY